MIGIVVGCLAAAPLVALGVRKYMERRWGHFKKGDGEIILDGKVFLVTGASAGIGKETTRELARLGATVIMACRDMEKANQAVKDIRSTVDSGKLIPMELDLSKLDSVRSFAQRVLRDFPRIDVLINNAGVSVPYRSTTDDGFEMNFGVNHMGHYLLTRLLLDRVVQSAPSRIVIVASTLHERGRIDFDDLSGEKWTWPADGGKVRLSPGYCNSKLANVYFARELADRLRTTQGEGSAQDVTVVSLCPGFCYTELFRYSDIKWYQYVMFAPVALLFMRSASQGCQTVLHCALSKEVKGKSGMMFRNCQEYVSGHKFDDAVQKRLWEVSESLVKFEEVENIVESEKIIT